MRILLNLATLKKGGGQNVGLNFIRLLVNEKRDLSQFLFVAAEDSAIESELVKNNIGNRISVPSNALKRMLFEVLNGKKILKKHKIDIIYTMFGIGLYPKSYTQVSGSADSNIFFPEINFWEGYKGFARFKKTIVDKYRIQALKRANAVVFENEAMLIRSEELFQLPNTFYSKPSINPDFPEEKLDFPSVGSDVKIGLFLCGWQKNKNYMLIPEILSEFKNKGIKFHIVITASKSEKPCYTEFMHKVKFFDVEEMVSVLGPVKKTELRALYKNIHYVFLLSKLESFSNNIIESWYFQKVLVISDREWSKAICKDGALYVDRDKASDIVEKILILENRDSNKVSIIEKANQILKTYPSIKEKVDLELNYIRSIYERN